MDWYMILLFGVGLLIFHMHLLAEHRSIPDFLNDGLGCRMPQNVVFLLFSLTGGLTFLLPLFLTVQYGYAAESAAAVAGAAVLIALGFRGRFHLLMVKTAGSEEDLLEQRFTSVGRRAGGLTLLLLGSEGLVLNIGFMALFLHLMLKVSPVWSVFCMLSFCVIFAVIGGAKGFWQMGLWLFAAAFVILTLLPLSVYTFEGIAPISERLESAALHSGGADWKLYAGSAVFMVFIVGRLLSGMLIHRPLGRAKPERAAVIYSLAALCWSAVPLAAGAMLIYLLSSADAPSEAAPISWSLISASLSAHLHVPLTYAVTGWLLCSCLLGAGMSLQGMVSLLPRSLYSGSKVHSLYLAGVLFCLPLWPASLFSGSYLEAAGLLYLQLYLAGTMPLVRLLHSPARRGVSWSVTIWVPALIGWIAALWSDWLYGSIINVILSYIIVLVAIRKT
ncbi:hypothetical protein Q5741_19735 [Paenibacillus sp. JX-17]|uniref:Uncharacterized protein n=1 Tax=Paenibacillus lacisoli TaxID=3064525 RepID=A0ABT9CLZ3_9BACL|nr:hypothetical protein [Paenibacillus sp. JX-17]MDO7908623.1 hypothetical protein [Paenibacillus sp. JX-17]